MPLALSVLIPLHAKPDDAIEPLVGWRYLTTWTFPWWVVLSLLLVAGLYLYGVRTLHKRGDRWPLWRTVSFVVLGLGGVAIATFSFLGAYDTVLFWTHMIQHMVLNMIAPVFLVSGAPMTLALRVLPQRPRKVLLAVLHSWVAKILLFPPLTLGIMIASPFLLYLTGWYDLTLRNDFHHDLLHIYMVTVGFLFFTPLLGEDPQPYNVPYPLRVLMFILTMPFHAFLGVIIMGSQRLIAEEWYLAFERDWGLSPLEDQNWAGGLMWATGDLTMAAAMTVIFVKWVRESQREARRTDRMLDREEARARAAAQRAEGLDSGETHDHSPKDA
jgi:cytochrome c oxidase assembly factor CtaG